MFDINDKTVLIDSNIEMRENAIHFADTVHKIYKKVDLVAIDSSVKERKLLKKAWQMLPAHVKFIIKANWNNTEPMVIHFCAGGTSCTWDEDTGEGAVGISFRGANYIQVDKALMGLCDDAMLETLVHELCHNYRESHLGVDAVLLDVEQDEKTVRNLSDSIYDWKHRTYWDSCGELAYI